MDTAPVIPILYDMEKNRSSLPEDKIPDLYKAAAAENIAEGNKNKNILLRYILPEKRRHDMLFSRRGLNLSAPEIYRGNTLVVYENTDTYDIVFSLLCCLKDRGTLKMSVYNYTDIRTDVSISKKKFPAGDETADPNDLYSYSDTAKRISKKTKNDNDDRRVREILDSEKQQKELISRVFSRFRAEFETEETETLGQWTPKIRGIMDANQYTPFQFTAFDGLDSYKEYRRTLLNVTEFPSLVNFDMFISLLIMHPRFIPAKLQTPNPINI